MTPPAEAHGVSRRAALAAALLGGAALGAFAQPAPQAAADEPSALERIRARGRLVVGVYEDLPPFHQRGAGIEPALAAALARELGVGLTLLPFAAGEDMQDDLRNMVWRGHYLGFGPADVLLHVPVDAPLIAASPRVQIFAPYWRERVAIARDLSQLPALDSLDAFGRAKRIAVPGQSLAGWLLIGAEGGRLRDQLSTTWKDGTEAARALLRGEVAAAAGTTAELQSVLRDDARFAIGPLPMPRARDGWAVGMAVKKGATDLAQALQAAVVRLGASGELATMFAAQGLTWRAP